MRILIAEDEYYARKALEQNVRDWDQDAEILTADNGRGALELLRENDVDILLLDIKMPQLDGLALSAKLFQEGMGVYTIIISGYSDFDYARQALKMGVREYLLKPINPDMLCEALETAYDEISRREREKMSEADRANLIYRQKMRALLAWLQNPDGSCPAPLREGFDRNCPCHAVMFFGRISDRTGAFVQNGLNAMGYDAHFYGAEPQWIGVLALPTAGGQRPEELASGLRRSLPIGVCAAVSDAFPVREAASAYRQAQSIYSIRCLGGDAVLTSRVLRDRTEYVNMLEGEQGKALYYQLAHRKEKEAVTEVLTELRSLTENPVASPYCIQDMLNGICAQINRVSAQIGQDMRPGVLSGVTLRLEEFDRMEELQDRVRQMIHAVCGLQGGEVASHSQEIVSIIRGYIDEHFSENISLKTLASTKLYMNVSYLSRLFKAATGTSFRTYLTDTRMRKAASMLCLREDSITRIAMDCGYTDVSHFIQLFRRRYGVTPNVFREMYAGRDVGELPET